jgi:hypothetical protein
MTLRMRELVSASNCMVIYGTSGGNRPDSDKRKERHATKKRIHTG